jgi:hypothetical protein
MNLQELRDELTTRAATADERPSDLLPGVKHKIHRTRQRRVATALGAVVALAVVAIGVVPSLRASTPKPAQNPPPNYSRDGITVPGTIDSDKLLKAWIGDRGQEKLSFSWTPTTNSVSISATCSGDGNGMKSIRIRIGDWRVTEAGCVGTDEGWSSNLIKLYPDAAFWLDNPVGKPLQVSAEMVDLQTREPGAQNARIALGIYSTDRTDRDSGSGAPSRLVPPGPADHTENGVTYRARVGGDTLAGASVAAPGVTETRFSFTAAGKPLVLHAFCTANRTSDTNPYQVSMQFGASTPYLSTCDGSSADATLRSSLTVPSPVPAGQRVEVVARIIPSRKGVPSVPAGSRLGLGVYFQGAQQVVDGVSLPELTEVAGYDYRLDEVRTASGPAGQVTIDTPADQPYVIASGSSPLGSANRVEATLAVRGRETGRFVEPGTGEGLGLSWDGHGPGPAERATMKITVGKPTKGTVILAIYLPI